MQSQAGSKRMWARKAMGESKCWKGGRQEEELLHISSTLTTDKHEDVTNIPQFTLGYKQALKQLRSGKCA